MVVATGLHVLRDVVSQDIDYENHNHHGEINAACAGHKSANRADNWFRDFVDDLADRRSESRIKPAH